MIDSPFVFQKKEAPEFLQRGKAALRRGDRLKALAQLEGSRPHSPEWTQVLSGEASRVSLWAAPRSRIQKPHQTAEAVCGLVVLALRKRDVIHIRSSGLTRLLLTARRLLLLTVALLPANQCQFIHTNLQREAILSIFVLPFAIG